MSFIEVKGIKLELDDNGFLKEPEKWTEEVAIAISIRQNLDKLNKDHWKVINHIRNYYLEYNVPPTVRRITKETGFDIKYIYELFPLGPIKGACAIAGLPQPTGCV
ncbi:MAG: TusE/DsrC/DsvC family sulfur relay protein [Dehalococcoidia bacterium]